jgi:branched-subunit amino acid ABC-type transport system permease component
MANTSDTSDTLVPSDPSPQMVTLVYAVLRHLLAALGVILGMWGIHVTNVATGDLMVLSGAVAWFFMLALSLWQKYRAAKASHASAVASAVKGVAVKIV